MARYEDTRNFPAEAGTSRLSPHLHFGEIGPRQVWTAVQALSKDSGVFPPSRGAQGYLTEVGWRGPGGLSVCVLLDWGLEVCDYHLSATQVDLGERVVVGERIASVGSSGVSTGPHVHWEARTNGVLVDPMTYAPARPTVLRVGGATGSP
jgi:hypothetical protein